MTPASHSPSEDERKHVTPTTEVCTRPESTKNTDVSILTFKRKKP